MGLEIFFDTKTALFGFKDENDEIVIPAKYALAANFSEGFAVVEYNKIENGKFARIIAFIDEEGNEIKIDCERARSFTDGLAALKINGNWKLVDTHFQYASDENSCFKNPEDLKITNLQILTKLVEVNGVKVLNWADPTLFVSNENFEVLKTALKNHLKGLVLKIDVTKVTSEIEFTNLIQNEYNKLKDIRENKLKQVVKEDKTNGHFFSMVDEMIK